MFTAPSTDESPTNVIDPKKATDRLSSRVPLPAGLDRKAFTGAKCPDICRWKAYHSQDGSSPIAPIEERTLA